MGRLYSASANVGENDDNKSTEGRSYGYGENENVVCYILGQLKVEFWIEATFCGFFS